MKIYQDITPKQKQILRFIQNKIIHEGKPPTIREIACWFGFKSTGTVRDYLRALAQKGYIKITPNKARAIELIKAVALRIPILGHIPAGRPELIYEEVDNYFAIDELLPSSEKEIFALRIKGDSLIEKGIFEGDLAIVKKQQIASDGDIVAARLLDNNETTVKIFRNKNNSIYLEPANKNFSPIHKEFNIIGKVIAILRKL